MTEQFPHAYTFEDIEALSVDPVVARAIEVGKTAADLLNKTPNPTKDTKHDLIRAVDAEWPFTRHICKVSGWTHDVERDGDTMTEQRQYVDNESMVSNGFYFLREPAHATAVVTESPYTLTMGFARKDKTGAYNDTHGTAHNLVFLKPDEALVEYPAHSLEFGEMHLRRFHEDLLHDIDQRLATSLDEATQFMAFADFTISLQPSGKEDMLFLNDVANYIRKNLDFDADVPYLLHAEQPSLMASNGKPIPSDQDFTGYYMPRSLTMSPVRGTSGVNTSWSPALNGILYPRQRADPVQLLVPADTVRDFKALRSH